MGDVVSDAQDDKDDDDKDSLNGDVSATKLAPGSNSASATRVTLRRDVSPARLQRDVTHLSPLTIDAHDDSHLDISRDSLDADSLGGDDDDVTSRPSTGDIVSGDTPSNDQMSPSTPFSSLLSVYKADAGKPRSPMRQLRVSLITCSERARARARPCTRD